jgi:hypothetical protein
MWKSVINLNCRVILQQEGITDFPVKKKRKLPEPPQGPFIGPVPTLGVPGEDEGESSLPDCFMPHPDYVSQSISELRELQGKRDAELIAAENILHVFYINYLLN